VWTGANGALLVASMRECGVGRDASAEGHCKSAR
jgi:hypothetical protein